MIVESGIKLFKYYLDISKKEQEQRLEDRRTNPLTQWKISPIDEVAVDHWGAYSKARNVMFERTHHASGPWTIIRADNKRVARINLIKHMLLHIGYKGKDKKLVIPDPNISFEFEESCLHNGMIAP
jgi:polyphosphate kinase 2 (PPK2 family)